MKREAKPWQEKVDEFCLKFLEIYREGRRLMSQAAGSQDLASFVRMPDPAEDVFKQHPDLWERKTICLKPEFVQMLEPVPALKAVAVVGEHAYPARMADILEMMQNLALFPSFPPEVKLGGYFGLALVIVVLKDFLGTMRRMQYGAEPLDQAKIATLAAQFFELIAQLCRGHVPQTKGRYNLELLELVKMIQEHQRETMTPGDLRKALTAAGVSVPQGETWRIWLWRARRDGLIPGGPAVPESSKKSKGGLNT